MFWRDWFTQLGTAVTSRSDVVDVLAAAAHVPIGLSRRQFLRGALAATTAAATVDLDQLLWLPGEKTIFLPDVVALDDLNDLSLDWITREVLRILNSNLTMVRPINRQFEPWADRLGDDVQVRVPHGTGIATVRLDRVVGVELDSDAIRRCKTLDQIVRTHLEPAVAGIAKTVRDHQVNVFGKLELPGGLQRLMANVAVDAQAGLAIRGALSYDIETDHNLLRLDLLGGTL